MTAALIDCCHLSPAAAGKLTKRKAGKLTPVLTWESEAEPFTARDCFDQSLRRSSRLLLATDTTLVLFGNGPVRTQPAPEQLRFVTGLASGPVRQALADVSPLRSLLAVGAGELRHIALSFVDDEEKTHCRARLVLLKTSKGRSAALLTLQTIRGYGPSLEVLREHVRALGGVAWDSDAVYTRCFPLPNAYVAKPDIPLSDDDTAFDAANRIVASCLPVARANEWGVIADHDTEFLHDYRIQLRKIRSVLSLFRGIYSAPRTAELKARFSTLMAPTGQLRDLDVYLLEKPHYYDLLPKSLHSGLDVLFDTLTAQRQAEHARLARHFRGRKYKQEISELARLFTHAEELPRGGNAGLPAHEYACGLIWKRYRKVCKTAAGIDSETDDAEVHELRIHCKKLRYLMEFFGPMFPQKAFRALLRPLKTLQDNLGLFNDYSVQQARLQAFLLQPGTMRDATHLDVAQSIGALIAVLHNRQLEERAKVVKSFARFHSPKTQQTFSELFRQRPESP